MESITLYTRVLQFKGLKYIYIFHRFLTKIKHELYHSYNLIYLFIYWYIYLDIPVNSILLSMEMKKKLNLLAIVRLSRYFENYMADNWFTFSNISYCKYISIKKMGWRNDLKFHQTSFDKLVFSNFFLIKGINCDIFSPQIQIF